MQSHIDIFLQVQIILHLRGREKLLQQMMCSQHWRTWSSSTSYQNSKNVLKVRMHSTMYLCNLGSYNMWCCRADNGNNVIVTVCAGGRREREGKGGRERRERE